MVVIIYTVLLNMVEISFILLNSKCPPPVVYCVHFSYHREENSKRLFQVYVYSQLCIVLFFKKNLNASKPSEHPPQVEECLKV